MPTEPIETPDGAALISAERRRQTEHEGWTPEHDDGHINFELSRAARAYTSAAEYAFHTHKPTPAWIGDDLGWPWEQDAWKPTDDPVRNLVKAGALIAAEIDRLQRLSPPLVRVVRRG